MWHQCWLCVVSKGQKRRYPCKSPTLLPSSYARPTVQPRLKRESRIIILNTNFSGYSIRPSRARITIGATMPSVRRLGRLSRSNANCQCIQTFQKLRFYWNNADSSHVLPPITSRDFAESFFWIGSTIQPNGDQNTNSQSYLAMKTVLVWWRHIPDFQMRRKVPKSRNTFHQSFLKPLCGKLSAKPVKRWKKFTKQTKSDLYSFTRRVPDN
jgi:hypothetical protein